MGAGWPELSPVRHSHAGVTGKSTFTYGQTHLNAQRFQKVFRSSEWSLFCYTLLYTRGRLQVGVQVYLDGLSQMYSVAQKILNIFPHELRQPDDESKWSTEIFMAFWVPRIDLNVKVSPRFDQHHLDPRPERSARLHIMLLQQVVPLLLNRGLEIIDTCMSKPPAQVYPKWHNQKIRILAATGVTLSTAQTAWNSLYTVSGQSCFMVIVRNLAVILSLYVLGNISLIHWPSRPSGGHPGRTQHGFWGPGGIRAGSPWLLRWTQPQASFLMENALSSGWEGPPWRGKLGTSHFWHSSTGRLRRASCCWKSSLLTTCCCSASWGFGSSFSPWLPWSSGRENASSDAHRTSCQGQKWPSQCSSGRSPGS